MSMVRKQDNKVGEYGGTGGLYDMLIGQVMNPN